MTSNSVTWVQDRIAAICLAHVEGIVTAWTFTPREIQGAELPGVIVSPGACNYRKEGNTRIEEQNYFITLYVGRLMSGTEDQTQAALYPYWRKIDAVFTARPGLELNDDTLPETIIDNASIIDHDGIGATEYPAGSGAYYATTTFTLVVRTDYEIAYQD